MQQTGLKFIVVGASVTGLAAAIALKKSGHNVIVLEKETELGGHYSPKIVQGCARVPPNGYKILVQWGLEAEVKAHAVINPGFGVYKYDGKKASGRELMGLNEWDSELLADALGDYMTIAHKDLLRIMYNKATEATGSERNDTPSSETHVGRVTVLFGAEVADVYCDSEPPVVTMRSGDIYRADAVIGADGPNGIVRRTLMQCEGAGPSSDVFTGVSTYSAVVPRALIAQDRDLDSFYEYPQSTISMGPGRGLVTEMAGQSNDLFIFVLAEAPDGSQGGTWRDPANNTMADIVGPCDTAIKKLAALAGPAAALQNKKYYVLSSWVAESGRVAVIGEAAHPLRPCGQHTYSAALEDGVFIGKIFSHSHDPSRIPELLYAFEEHRKPRCEFINNIEQTYLDLIMMPDGDAQEGRDAMMRANYAAGRNVFQSEGDMQEMLEETHQLFSYDAADDADEWWVSWGRYRDMEQK